MTSPRTAISAGREVNEPLSRMSRQVEAALIEAWDALTDAGVPDSTAEALLKVALEDCLSGVRDMGG